MKVLISTFTLLVAFSASLFATQDKKQLKIRLQAPGGTLDEVTVYFDQGVSDVYNYQEDAQKVFSGVAGVPVIYSPSSDNVPLSINGFNDLTTALTVPLVYDVDADGLYTFSAPLINNFDPSSIVRVEDRQLGVEHDLRAGAFSVQLLANDPGTNRFYIHVSYPTTFSSVNAGCANNDGVVHVELDNSITWSSATLYDAFNTLIGTQNNVTGVIDFNGLSEGDYYVVLSYNGYSVTKNFHIEGNYVLANIGASKYIAYVGEDIDFHALTTHSSAYAWDFGDGTLINGVANPTLSYYEPGTYQVQLQASNSQGCSDNASVTVVINKGTGIDEQQIGNVSVTAYAKQITVKVGDEITGTANITIYNLLGQSVYNQPLNGSITNVNFVEQPQGYYLVSVKNNDKVTTKRVFVGQ